MNLGAVAAVMAVANILRSSLGPQGLDKMLVDDIGRECAALTRGSAAPHAFVRDAAPRASDICVYEMKLRAAECVDSVCHRGRCCHK